MLALFVEEVVVFAVNFVVVVFLGVTLAVAMLVALQTNNNNATSTKRMRRKNCIVADGIESDEIK